ncbi:primosomal protein N' [Clostridium sp. UBA4548]|uniref:primosomal protein N' n=1 Tax=Clostridium sp. UBA4548 TaxID=1946361 RepID=UPI0025C03A03|nr:primosomal protein N' [Clostridium sp. UBA4548]
MYNYAGVIVNNDSVKVDKIFTYKVPEGLKNKINLGQRVKVPFGMGNKNIDGFIVQLYEYVELDAKSLSKLKAIIEIGDDFQVIREKDISLIGIMRAKYLCTYLECIKVFIPSGITKGMKFKTKNVVVLGEPLTTKYEKESYKKILEFIKENDGNYSKQQLSNEFGFSVSSINTLIKHGFLILEEAIINRYNDRQYNNYEERTLNSLQQQAVNTIMNSKGKKFLIHGVTGSGKTEIYMNLVKKAMENGKDSIILIPEISLTPQMVERFKGRFGKNVAIFHSKLSDGERFDEWMRVKMGKVKVAIGARSAIFLPFSNLGLIVIDEEHEASYKSDSDPKYNARDIAELKSDIEGCKVVLGSATPAIESYYKATKGEYMLITLSERADGAMLPQVKIVDMREELMNDNKSIFSASLFSGLKHTLANKEQAILFLNRRGFSTFVSCRKCGFVFKCSNCDIALTYHNYSSNLTCHYCGAKRQLVNTCPRCKSKYVKYFGIGTEQLEDQVKKVFPEARTLRMDFDTTRGKNSYEKIYNSFRNEEHNVLIGTQMVAKGLDFPNVTLVGVIAADLSLNLPDYRASERTFQLITQVSGRAGRGKKPGRVVVQTYTPESFSIKYAVENDYKSFYKEEIEIRRAMNYPPFAKILAINLSSEDEKLLIKSIQDLGDKLHIKLDNNDKIEVLGPCPCGISKIKSAYRWQILIKGEFTTELAEEIKDITYNELNSVHNYIKVGLDVNPNNLL